MSPESMLRWFDMGRAEPDARTIACLEADGHDPVGFCFKCWRECGENASAYLARLDEVEVEASQRCD